MESNTFSIAPVISKGFSISTLLFILITLGLVAMFIGIFFSANRIQYEITPKGLNIKNAILYGRTIPKEIIKIGDLRLVNLNQDKALNPTFRTNGIGMPGFQSGWFRLKNKEKALLFVTDHEKVIYLPTTKNYSLLISVNEPDQMLARMKKMWQ